MSRECLHSFEQYFEIPRLLDDYCLHHFYDMVVLCTPLISLYCLSLFPTCMHIIHSYYALITGHDTDSQDSDPDCDIIIREINNLSKSLMFNGSLTTEEKEEIVEKIGHMAYMGECCTVSSHGLYRHML